MKRMYFTSTNLLLNMPPQTNYGGHVDILHASREPVDDRRRRLLAGGMAVAVDAVFGIAAARAQTATAGKLVPAETAFVQVRPGAGPRHIVFHPTAPLAFVAQELDSAVGVYRYDAQEGALTPLQVLPSTPDTYTGANFTLDPTGRTLYAANENSDTIVAFDVDPASGTLRSTGRVVKTGSPVCIVFSTTRQRSAA